jgi:hypothetical protein
MRTWSASALVDIEAAALTTGDAKTRVLVLSRAVLETNSTVARKEILHVVARASIQAWVRLTFINIYASRATVCRGVSRKALTVELTRATVMTSGEKEVAVRQLKALACHDLSLTIFSVPATVAIAHVMVDLIHTSASKVVASSLPVVVVVTGHRFTFIYVHSTVFAAPTSVA